MSADDTPVLRLALTLPEAAASLGISLRHLRDQVLPDLKVVRVGSSVRVSVKELERWIDANETLTGRVEP